MILHEFKCTKCNLVFENWADQKQKEEGVPCKRCKAVSFKKFSATPSIWKNGQPSPTGTDKIIGLRALKANEFVNKRVEEKNKIRKESNLNFVNRIDNNFVSSSIETKNQIKQVMNEYGSLPKDEKIRIASKEE